MPRTESVESLKQKAAELMRRAEELEAKKFQKIGRAVVSWDWEKLPGDEVKKRLMSLVGRKGAEG